MAASGKSIYTALMEARANMGKLIKDSTNPHFKNKYASLEAVIDVIDEPLQSAGISWNQTFDTRDDGILVLRTMFHFGDQTMRSDMPVICKDPGNPQAVAGAITYFRRYSLITMCGLTPEDDDGNAAASAPVRSPEPRSEAKTPEGELSPPQYAAAVKKAITGRNGDALRELVDQAGDNHGRWITLIKAADSDQALEWIEKQLERRNVSGEQLNVEIGKRRGQLQA
jgi:hypothetical protein